MAYLIVDGIVDNTFYDGKGVRFHEEFTKRDGEVGKAYFTAWFEDAPNLNEGDKGTFKGNLSVRLNEYEKDGETKVTADASINNAKFEQGSDAETPF